MSLLLDALRRAEEARRAKEASSNATQAEGNAPSASKSQPLLPEAPSSSPSFSPVPSSPPSELTLDDPDAITPDQSRSLEASEIAPFTAYQSGLALEEISGARVEPTAPAESNTEVVSRSATKTSATIETRQRDAARNVFASKQPLQTKEGSDKRKWLLPIIAGIFVILGAGGWYVWNEISRVSRPSIARPSSPPAALPPAAPNPRQIGSKPIPKDVPMVAQIEEAPLPPLLPPPAVEAPLPTLPAASATARALSEREALAKKLNDAPVAKEAEVGLKLARTIEPPRLNPELAIAYQSLANGDYALAQRQYSKLVLAEPLNVDAHLGLATAAARGGNGAMAARHYRQVLALDPRNGLAIMGLVALNEGAQPASLEIELKTLIGRNPDAAPLHFALGNLYAGGRRWTEAQQAYFEAFRIDAANPDYLFNLAVSLDQLRQTRLALEYYRRAEAVALAKGGGQFDRATVARRIKELSSENGRSN
ncbi:MAG: hypothetical protein LH481_16910 [Burkholderiales bacterium]|nr:hypothetical protein [Burkholderiales bacterium]